MKTKANTEQKVKDVKCTVTQIFNLFIKGQEFEITREEAEELRAALCAILGKPDRDTQLEQIKRKLEDIKDKPIPIPYTPPVTIPWDSPCWPRKKPYYPDIWCSSNNTMRLSVSAITN